MKIALLADDLTGANNAGVRLVKEGFSTATVMHGAASLPDGYDAICIDTDSRYTSADEARQRIVQAVARARARGAELVCKRIDTLMRGNIGAEIDAALSACGPDAIAIVAAAFPELNRIVKGGHLFVDAVPVNENAVAASDAISPVRHSYVPDIIAEQSSEPSAVVELSVVLEGVEALVARIKAAVGSGKRVVVIDTTRADHIDTIAKAMLKLEMPLVPVDPGPLSAVYASFLFGSMKRDRRHKILVSVGSTSALTRQQLDYALRKWEVKATCVRAELLATTGEKRTAAIEGAVADALEGLKSARVAVVTTLHSSGPADLQKLAVAERVAPATLAKRIADGLGEISRDIIRRSNGDIGGCYSSGGDVTAAFYQRAGSTGFEIIEEVTPLVAHVRVLGGAFDGLLMVTKGGSVGAESTLSDCLRFLFEKLGQVQ